MTDPTPEQVEAARAQLYAQVQDLVFGEIWDTACLCCISPAGIEGHVEMAMGVNRQPLVIAALRQAADTMEKMCRTKI